MYNTDYKFSASDIITVHEALLIAAYFYESLECEEEHDYSINRSMANNFLSLAHSLNNPFYLEY